MAVTEADFDDDVSACRAAILADDRPTAMKYYRAAEAANAALPVQASGDGQAVTRRATLDGLAKALKDWKDELDEEEADELGPWELTSHGVI